MAGEYGGSMPLLVLARHAHSSPARAGQSDFDRPLSAEGLVQALRLGEHLAPEPIHTVIASPALRTRTTAEAVVAARGLDPAALRTDPALYAGGLQEWIDAFALIPEESPGAVVVGHQPTVSGVVAHLADGGATGWVPSFPPSSIAVLRLDSWEQLTGAVRPEYILDFAD